MLPHRLSLTEWLFIALAVTVTVLLLTGCVPSEASNAQLVAHMTASPALGPTVEAAQAVIEAHGGAAVLGADACADGLEYAFYQTADGVLTFVAVRDSMGRTFLIEVRDEGAMILGLPSPLTGPWTFIKAFDDKQYRGGPVCPAVEAAHKLALLERTKAARVGV